MERILVPTDLTERGNETVRQTIELIGSREPSIVVLHVIPPYDWDRLVLTSGTREELLVERGRWAQERLGRLVEDLQSEGYRVVPLTMRGPAAATIVACAKKLKVDAIYLTARTAADRLQRPTLGTVSDQVIRQAPCPVTCLPEKNAAAPSLDELLAATCAICGSPIEGEAEERSWEGKSYTLCSERCALLFEQHAADFLEYAEPPEELPAIGG